MRKLIVTFLLILGLVGSGTPEEANADHLRDQATQQLRSWITAAGNSGRKHIGKERVWIGEQICAFYERRDYRPAWSDADGPLPQVEGLVAAIRNADREGLRPVGYHLDAIISAAARLKKHWSTRTKQQITEYDLLLTDAFLSYGSHLFYGRHRRSKDPSLSAERRHRDLTQLLEIALKVNDMEVALESLLPPHLTYARLRQALAEYRERAKHETWPTVPAGPKMQLGDAGKRVGALRRRLIASGHLISSPTVQKVEHSPVALSPPFRIAQAAPATEAEQVTDAPQPLVAPDSPATTPPPVPAPQPVTEPIDPALVFDASLEQAVRRFQEQHGLAVDGVVGPATLAALNVSLTQRVRQIALNMERWRSYPHSFGQRYVIVNVAASRLDVMEDGQSVMHMRTVVGQKTKRWQTPIFSDTMEYVVLNPNWYIPPSIARREILPAAKRDPSYLRRRGIRVFSSAGAVNPNHINWANVSAHNLPFRFQQRPGSNNALGAMKFIFPNRYNVYLHDTPSQSAFRREGRTLSHGCIRIEKPLDLAEYILQGKDSWTRKKIDAALKRHKTRRVYLPDPLPVHLLYWTVEVTDDGTLQFYPDIYESDKTLAKALGKSLAV